MVVVEKIGISSNEIVGAGEFSVSGTVKKIRESFRAEPSLASPVWISKIVLLIIAISHLTESPSI